MSDPKERPVEQPGTEIEPANPSTGPQDPAQRDDPSEDAEERRDAAGGRAGEPG